MNKTSLMPHHERILSLDIVRGVAALGFLITAIHSFSSVQATTINPMANGMLSGTELTMWSITHLLADQKFLDVLALCFGAGILLFSEHVKNHGYRPGRFYSMRLFGLFTLGLMAGYLLWHGDILVAFALGGAIAFLFRNISAWVLLTLGLMIFAVPAFNYWLFGSSMSMWPSEAVDSIRKVWAPDQQAIEREVASLTGSYLAQLTWRIPQAFKMETFTLLTWLGWRTLAVMLMGMSLWKLGLFSLAPGKKFYALMSITLLSIGYLLVFTGMHHNAQHGWSVEYAMFFGWQWNYFGSLFVSLGYVMLILLLTRYFQFQLLARVGKMSLTLYFLMMISASIIFYDAGFFNTLTRLQLLGITVAGWLGALALAHFWFQKYRFGPVEWLLRWLTYGNKPPFIRK